VYTREMLGTRGHAELTHYEERLKLVLGDEVFALAIDMLTEAAVKKCLTAGALRAFRGEYGFEGRSVEEVQKEIIRVLEHDGYWRRDSKVYVFDSQLLRDWWEARHRFGYVPVEERGN
jgi:hypothetical protein